MSNKEKLHKAMGKALDNVTDSLSKKEPPKVEDLEALRVLTNLASLNCQID